MGSIRSLNNLIEIREEEDDYVSFFYFFCEKSNTIYLWTSIKLFRIQFLIRLDFQTRTSD